MELFGIIFEAFLRRNKEMSKHFLYLLFLFSSFCSKIKESFSILSVGIVCY